MYGKQSLLHQRFSKSATHLCSPKNMSPRQCHDDAEFNYGFIYDQQLVSAAYQSAMLGEEEPYLTNCLNETLNELTMRMNLFYPTFDVKMKMKM